MIITLNREISLLFASQSLVVTKKVKHRNTNHALPVNISAQADWTLTHTSQKTQNRAQ
jgi:hypothetical protein